jgi:hypothetical protein
MAYIIAPEDLEVGRFSLAINNYSEEENQAYIDYYEKFYLTRLLGADLYTLFINDLLNGIPQTQRFIDIFNPYSIDKDNCLYISDGIKVMLEGLVFTEIARKDIKRTLAGSTRNVSDNGEIIPAGRTYLTQAFNLSVDTYQEIQSFIEDDEATYPEYNGVLIHKMAWL